MNNVLKKPGTYTFSVWHKAENAGNVTFNIFGRQEVVSSSTAWHKYVATVTVDNITNKTIDIIPSENTRTYLYEGSLVEGIVDTSWNPAPEDTDTKIFETRTEFLEKAGEIEMNVAKKNDKKFSGVKYIRDWLNGSNIDNNNYFCEIQVMQNTTNIESGTNIISSGRTPTSNQNIVNPNLYTDNDINTEEYPYISFNDWCYLQIEFDEIMYDIEQIKVWHYFKDNRMFNHRLEISCDGISWISLFDSDVQGCYPETSLGKTYYLDDNSIQNSISFIKLNIDHIQQQVRENEENYSSIDVHLNSITQRVESSENELENIQNEMLPNIEKNFTRKIAEIQLASDSITNKVTTLEDDIKKQAEEILDANGWKVSLANIGGYDSSYATTTVNMILTPDGLSVTRSASQGYRTQITGDTIKIDYDDGRGNYDEAMRIDKDIMYLTRMKVSNGIDHYTIKEIPVSYGNCKGLAFISSSGNS